MMNSANNSHSTLIGYILWLFGFTGAHRFYYGKPISGTIWFFTGGLFLIGWIVDLFLIPGMDAAADNRYLEGPKDYNVSWLLLAFLGIFGVHRFYLGKWLTGLLYLCTGGLFGIGYLYDLWTLNGQVDEANRQYRPLAAASV
jgi:TM2 domain-containing membrane protein YozV